ncbi:hypothetical protein CPLU01_12784 [Colletotrichum plurivorum]|uniref:Uncharacterized protein n=1 Tax=Colletotrichum plurivorum TaxID=2175906 RepID=A0A8H6JX23_9PEZI|nr:hypothetical protein CPLU01_12784 [Colletotrichum plurivorum]
MPSGNQADRWESVNMTALQAGGDCLLEWHLPKAVNVFGCSLVCWEKSSRQAVAVVLAHPKMRAAGGIASAVLSRSPSFQVCHGTNSRSSSPRVNSTPVPACRALRTVRRATETCLAEHVDDLVEDVALPDDEALVHTDSAVPRVSGAVGVSMGTRRSARQPCYTVETSTASSGQELLPDSEHPSLRRQYPAPTNDNKWP